MANSLRLKLTADTAQFSSSMRRASQEVESAVRAMRAQFGGLQTLGAQLQGIGFAGLAGLTAPILAAGVAITKVRGDIDALERGLVAITGSADRAAEQFARLREVAKLPGLGLEEAVRASVNLQAVGFSAEKAERNIMAFGNALALVGRGRADLDEVVRQLGQLANRGKVTADNLKPILERVPQVAQVIKREFGTIDTEVLQKLGVSSEQFIDAVIAGLEKLPRATGGVKNEIENLQDSIKIALNDLGKSLEPVIAGLLRLGSAAVTGLSDLAADFAATTPAAKALTLALVGLAGGIPAVIVALGSLSNAILAVRAAAAAAGIALGGPAGIVTGLISLVAIGGAAVYAAGEMASAFNDAEIAAHGMASGVGDLRREMKTVLGASPDEATRGVRELVSALGGEADLLVELEEKTGRVITARRDATAAIAAQTNAIKEHAGKLQEVLTYEQMLSDALGSIQRREASDVINAIAEAMHAVASQGNGAVQAVQDFADALARAGVESPRAVEALRQFEDGLQFIERVKRGDYRITTDDLIAVDFSKLELPPIDTTDLILDLPVDVNDRARREIDKLYKTIAGGSKVISRDSQRALREVSTVFTDMSRDMARLIFEGGKLKDVLVNAARSIGEAFVRLLLQDALQPIMRSMLDIMAKIPVLGKMLGGLGGSAASSLPGVAGSAGGAAGASSAVSAGLTGIVGAVASVASAVTGVIGNVQNARQEGTLNAIEHETRYSQIHLLNILEKINRHLPGIDDIHLRQQEFRTFGIGVYPQPGYEWGQAKGGVTVNATIGAVYGGPAGLDALMNELVARMRLAGVLPR